MATNRQRASVRPGGGVIISVRDYEKETRETQLKPERVFIENGVRHILMQVWEFDGDVYEMAMYLVKDDGILPCQVDVMRAKYYAVSTTRLAALLESVGFEDVKRIDKTYFQPALVGTKKR